jgi:hypothetical protein
MEYYLAIKIIFIVRVPTKNVLNSRRTEKIRLRVVPRVV